MVEGCQREESIESNFLVKINIVYIENIHEHGHLILPTQKNERKKETKLSIRTNFK